MAEEEKVITCPWCGSMFTMDQVKDRYEVKESPIFFCPNMECNALLFREDG